MVVPIERWVCAEIAIPVNYIEKSEREGEEDSRHGIYLGRRVGRTLCRGLSLTLLPIILRKWQACYHQFKFYRQRSREQSMWRLPNRRLLLCRLPNGVCDKWRPRPMALGTLGVWDIWHVGQMAFRSYGTCLTACGTNGVYQMASGTSGTCGTNGI